MKDLVAFHRGDIIGERDGVEVRKAVHGNGRSFDAWTSLMEPFEEVLSDSTKIGRRSCMDLLLAGVTKALLRGIMENFASLAKLAAYAIVIW